MFSKIEEYLKKYGILADESAIANLTEHYNSSIKLYTDRQDDIMRFEKYNIFTYMKADIAFLRDRLCSDYDNIIYAYFLYCALVENDKASIKLLSAPKKNDKDELYDILPLFSLLYCVPKMVEGHKKRGVPCDVISSTCNMFENQVQDFVDLNKRYGISDYVSWLKCFVDGKILRIGRFNFELTKYNSSYDVFENKSGKLCVMPSNITFHKSGQILNSVGCEDEFGAFFAVIEETDEYYIGNEIVNGIALDKKQKLSKSEWKKILTKGDRIISVHIPTGDRMTPDICDRDIQRCREIIDNCFSDYSETKIFYCASWLLDSQIKEIIGKDTNLTLFADRFVKFPMKSNGNDVYEYVFGLLGKPCDLNTLPENSSFSVAIKKHLISGKYIYGAYGVFK